MSNPQDTNGYLRVPSFQRSKVERLRIASRVGSFAPAAEAISWHQRKVEMKADEIELGRWIWVTAACRTSRRRGGNDSCLAERPPPHFPRRAGGTCARIEIYDSRSWRGLPPESCARAIDGGEHGVTLALVRGGHDRWNRPGWTMWKPVPAESSDGRRLKLDVVEASISRTGSPARLDQVRAGEAGRLVSDALAHRTDEEGGQDPTSPPRPHPQLFPSQKAVLQCTWPRLEAECPARPRGAARGGKHG